MLNLKLFSAWLRAVLIAACTLLAAAAAGAMTLDEALQQTPAEQLFEGADGYGAAEGSPAIVPVMKGAEKLGYAYLNSDFTASTGYSGKPIHILVGIDTQGIVRGINLVEHHEPIVLIGIPEQRVLDALNGLIGADLGRVAAGEAKPPQADIVAGATVTVLVMGDSIVRSAVKLIRSGRLEGFAAQTAPAEAARELDPSVTGVRDWQVLLGDGSVRSLVMTVGEVSQAFDEAGQPLAAQKPESRNPEDNFISLYLAPVSVPAIGRSLLGDVLYERMAGDLATGQAAVLVAGDGAYSFKGSGYVRGGIFDRIELIQDGQGLRFHDRDHTRIAALAAEGAPRLREIALFVVPEGFVLDVTRPFDLQMLVQRATQGREKATIPFDLAYRIPETYLLPAPEPDPSPVATTAPGQPRVGEPLAADDGPPLWKTIWQMNRVNIAITGVALALLTAIFFFQDVLTRRPVLFLWLRRAYLTFTLVWLGWMVNTQLSVVNVLTFFNSLLSGFSWDYFLSAPLVFILWSAVAAGLLFWGRGPFCGWLCPFGALQELSNTIARKLRVPQIDLPWGLHERLWPVKYMIFLGLFGLSLYSLSDAEIYAEVEPFKTAIILKFAREWGFVLFALACLLPGLFIERFYCRYLCPLGAALAIPGRMRMFEWLKRWPECGSPCHRCANDCPVKAIHPEGNINVNECIYCMNCQVLYHDDTRCPHMITVKARREKIARSAGPGAAKPHPAATQPDSAAGAARANGQQPPAFRAQRGATPSETQHVKGA
ncbi:NosR/NirI family transcriptional regulator, nitrous oxide reductase regulator [Paracoccus halophilus]|uniref:NosR/NirI family transcriptional regulator, nitrous oxide reductase regulator n=1 Tax=Paracoccus halophilus TaxID=376733 RepID=A0A1I0TTX1_9RHOB|nr:NosR/NirI family protein [Paracoccus halophilus]SFA55127.1 NosR/NirI family transcriptional regulator, nitrous oxide reductase regulator [Paracoccus halophilus]